MNIKKVAAMGGNARAKKLSKKRRSEIAKAAVIARWKIRDARLKKNLTA